MARRAHTPRAHVAATLALTAACAPPTRWLERALAPGDVVIAVVDVEHPEHAQAARLVADAAGAVTVSLAQHESALFAVLAGRDVVDARGGPVDLASLAVDLAGDAGTPCGCSAPPIEAPLRALAGDRCALPGWIDLEAGDGAPAAPELAALVRARLRLSWPGACASAPLTPVEGSLTVCPLGAGARWQQPVRGALGPDGTLALVSRGFATELPPAGPPHQATLTPALRFVVDAESLGARGTVVVTDVPGPLTGQRSQVAWFPGRGRAAPRVLAGVPIDANLSGVRRVSGPAPLLLYGSVAQVLSSVGALWRCALDDDALRCDGGPVRPTRECPSFGRAAVTDLTALGDGRILGVTNDAQAFVLDGDEARCLPERDAMPFLTAAGDTVDVASAGPVVAVGHTVMACVTGLVRGEPVALAVTATVGAGEGARVRWVRHAEVHGGAAYCGLAFVDERSGAHAAIEVGAGAAAQVAQLQRAGDAARVTVTTRDALFPELEDGVASVVSSTAGLAAITLRGEVWSAAAGAQAWTPRWSLEPRGPVQSGAVVATGAGFRVSGAGGAPVVVTVPRGPSCEGIQVQAAPEAYREADGAAHDDVLLALADRVVALGHTVDDVWLRAADGEAPVPLPGPARVVAAAEVIDGALALVRDDGTLWASDGLRAWPLDERPDAPWRGISAAGGVGWVYGSAALGRLLPAPGGLHLERDAWPAIDRRALDALARAHPPTLAHVRALPSGGAIVAFQEALDRTLQGDIDDITVWWMMSAPATLTLTPYALDPRGARPLFPQRVEAIAGEPETPLLVFAGTNQSAGLHVPGGATLALPFSTVLGVAWRGGDVLAVGPDLRMAVVRVRR